MTGEFNVELTTVEWQGFVPVAWACLDVISVISAVNEIWQRRFMLYTPLNEEYARHGGKVVDFHGWALPVQFSGIIEEHQQVRTKAGIFDCSHMGEFLLKGTAAVEALNSIVIADLSALKPYRCRYTAILNEYGGILDDCVAFRVDGHTMLLITNAGPLEKVADRLQKRVPDIRDISNDTAKVDIQGPISLRVMRDIGFDGVQQLPFWHGITMAWNGHDAWITRAGYTGELGYEVYLPAEAAPSLWRTLTAHPEVIPCGLGARDTLRTEMAYPLSGQDTDETITPLEASMDRFIAWQSNFPGKDRLLKQQAEGVKRRLYAICSVDRRSPRTGYELRIKDQVVGTVTSGTYGPTVGKGVGLARLNVDFGVEGQLLEAGDRRIPVRVCSSPIYKNASGRSNTGCTQ